MALCRAVWMIQARGESGTPVVAPLVDGGRKGFLRRLFGHVEVADARESTWRRSGPSRSDRPRRMVDAGVQRPCGDCKKNLGRRVDVGSVSFDLHDWR